MVKKLSVVQKLTTQNAMFSRFVFAFLIFKINLYIRSLRATGRSLVKLFRQDLLVHFKPNAYTILLSLGTEIRKAFR